MPNNPNTSAFLDFSRWTAAVLVLVSHATRLAFGEPSFFLLNLGHEAVVIFFVLSGYLVGGITLDRWQRKGPDFTDYAVHRFARIYTVFVPALVLTAALDLAGMHWFNGELYSGALNIQSIDPVAPRITPLIFAANVFMLGGIRTVTLGTNGPLWSLPYEWWYYCLFAFGVYAILRRSWWSAVALIVLTAVLPGKLLLWGLIWMLGAIAYFIRVRIPAWAGIALFVAAIAVTKTLMAPGAFLTDLIVALGYVAMLLASITVPWAAFHRWAAGFSYSLYLVHFPVLVFAYATGVRSFALLVGIALAVSIGFAYATERHTQIVRAFATRHIPRRWVPR